MATARSGQITVAATGTAVTGPDSGPGTFLLWANPANTGTLCYVGNDGADDVGSTTGYTLSKSIGNTVVLKVSNLNQWYFDADTNGDKIQYIMIEGESLGPAL